MGRRFLLSVGLLLANCSPRQAEVRYRFQVTISDSGRMVSEHAVWSTSVYRPLLSNATYGTHQNTEAIPFRLRDGSWLFVVPTESETSWPEFYYRKQFNIKSEDRVQLVDGVSRRLGWTFAVECSYDPRVYSRTMLRNRCPRTMIATDIKNRDSFRNIDLSQFPQADGHRLRIASILITITNDAPTDRIEGMIPWLRNARTGIEIYLADPSSRTSTDALPPVSELKTKS